MNTTDRLSVFLLECRRWSTQILFLRFPSPLSADSSVTSVWPCTLWFIHSMRRYEAESKRYKLLLFSRYKGPSTIIPGSALFPWIQLRRELTVHWYLLSDYYQTISMVKPTAYSLLLSLMPGKQSATLLLQSTTTHTHIQQ